MPTEYSTRAMALYGMARFSEAAGEARSGIQTAEDPRCYAILAAILSREKKTWKEGEQCLRTALSLEPESDWINYVASISYANRPDLTAAERHIRTALRLGPNQGYNHRQLAYLLRRRHDWKGVVYELDIALQLNPHDTEALAEKVTALTYLGRKTEAAQAKDALFELVPDLEDPHAKAGFLALTEGDIEKAFDYYREALRINPNSVEAREGVLDALRSRYRAYRWFFGFTVWNQSKPVGEFGLGFSAVFIGLRRVLRYGNLPMPVFFVLAAIGSLMILFLAAKFLVKPITNIALLFNPLGRLLLNPHQRAESASLLVSIILFAASIGLAVATSTQAYAGVAFVAALSIYMMGLLSKANENGAARWALFGFFLACQVIATGILI